MNKYNTYFTSFKSGKAKLASLFLFSFLKWDARVQTKILKLEILISGLGILTDRDQWRWAGELAISEGPKKYFTTDRKP